jgi:MOSC domain-containing protein YiiM
MKILSINVGRPKIIIIDGVPTKTAIFKQPPSGAVKVTKLNFEGDQQADLSVHGGPDKAVYVYSWENILYWRRQLRREDLGPGSFGENLTVEDLPDNEVAIGDELEAGTARFQVTQPRLPCFKLAAKMGLPGFPKVFLESGRTGFYLRVLKEGFVSAGDSISRIALPAPRRVTISEFTKLYRTHEASDDFLDKIISLEALPEIWKEWLRGKFPSRVSEGEI